MKTVSAFLLAAAVALAEPPKAVLSGPTEGLPGDFVDLTAANSVGDFFEWLVEPAQFADGRKTYRFPADCEGKPVAPQKSRECGIALRPGTYRITLLVSNEEGIARAEWKVTIFSEPPGKPPIVVIPPVDPPPPNGGNGSVPQTPPLSLWVTQSATQLVADDPTRAYTAGLLAASRRAWVKGSTLVTDPAQFAKYQQTLDKDVFKVVQTNKGHNPETAWAPFFKALAVKLSSMGMTTMEQHRNAWLQVAAGLERVPDK